MALTGSLLDFTAADILQLIKLQGKDGVLKVRGPRRWVSVSFRNGDVVMAARSGRDLIDAVGERLVFEGDLSRDAWAKARKACQRHSHPLDRVLREQGEAASEKVAGATEAYLRETVLSLFGWREGDYAFEPGTVLAAALENPLAPMDTSLLLMEGTSRAAEWAKIYERVPSLSAVFSPIAPQETQDAGGTRRTGGLSDAERRVLDCVDGVRDVQQVADACFRDLFGTCEALAWMVDRGVIERSRPAKAESRASVSAPVETPRPARRYGQRTMAAAMGLLCLALVLSCGWLLVTGNGPRDANATERFLEATWSFRDHKVRQALGVYSMVHGRYPAVLDQLVETGLVANPNVFSGMKYSTDGEGYTLHDG